MVQLSPPPGASTSPHAPACVAVAPTQVPPQHWSPLRHASPFCLQYDVSALHLPPTQPFEQHWLSAVHELPDAKHAPALFVTHAPPVQRPLQHSALLPQVVLRSLQALALQTPVEPQKPEQHCEFAVQRVPEFVVMHGPELLPHLFAS